MDRGYYYSTFSMDEWLDESSGINRLMSEGKVQLVHQTSYYGGLRVWVEIYLPYGLSAFEAGALGGDQFWVETKIPIKVPEKLSTEQPLTHDIEATVDSMAKYVDHLREESDRIASVILKIGLIGVGAYLFVQVIHPSVKAYRKTNT